MMSKLRILTNAINYVITVKEGQYTKKQTEEKWHISMDLLARALP